MSFSKPAALSEDRAFRIAIILAVCVTIAGAVLRAPTAFDLLVRGDNDDIMRLLSIRDWLGGQSWFDMTQYRILPPEGLSMHWSRFLDLAIAGILVPTSWVFPTPVAEQITLVVWPTLLLILLLVIVAVGTRRILGNIAAYGAMASILLWAPTYRLNFDVAQIDHHNVQILATTIAGFALIWPCNPVLRGLIAGTASAFSLAIGLEAIAFVAAIGGILVLRASFEREDANPLLAGFCVALTVGSLGLFVGQTAPARWFISECDKLSPPTILITLIAAVASLVPMAARRWLTRSSFRLMATATLSLLGVWLCSSVLLPCATGPYGHLPEREQQLIHDVILEAWPSLTLALERPLSFNRLIAPVIGAFVFGLVFWALRRGKPETPALETFAVGQMLFLTFVGIIGSLFQVRMIMLAAPAMPFITGYVIAALFQKRAESASVAASLLLIGGLCSTILAPFMSQPALALVWVAKGDGERARQDSPSTTQKCQTTEAMSELNALPNARILAPLELSGLLILLTHHDGLTGPYHRSSAAYGDGFFPYLTAQDMMEAVTRTKADYVIFCRVPPDDTRKGFFMDMQNGTDIPWLQPTGINFKSLVVRKVIPAELAKAELTGPSG